MSISIDPEALLAARRVLLRHELALAAASVVAPETGATTELTVAALARVATIADAVAADLRGLAESLSGLVEDLQRSDDGVTAGLELLRMRSLP